MVGDEEVDVMSQGVVYRKQTLQYKIKRFELPVRLS